MPALRALALIAVLATAPGQATQRDIAQERPAEPIVSNEPARAVPLYAGGGALDRYAPDPGAGYALLEVRLRGDTPVLILVDHDAHTSVRMRVLDAPSWADPIVAQSLSLETRRPFRGRDHLIEGGWVALPVGCAPQTAFVLVEAIGPARDIAAEVYDPNRPVPYRSLIRTWTNNAARIGIASPLQRQQRASAQLIWPWPVPCA